MNKDSIILPFNGSKFSDLGLEEVYASPREQYSHKAGRATRAFKARWSTRWDACAYLVGWSHANYSPSGTFTHVTRVLPEVYSPTVNLVPRKNNYPKARDDWGNAAGGEAFEAEPQQKPWLWASGVENMKGLGRLTKTFLPDGTSFSSYPHASLDVVHEVLHYRLLTDEELVEKDFTRKVSGVKYPDEFYAARYCSFHPQPNVLSMSVPQDGMKWAADAPGGLANKTASSDTQRKKFNVDIQVRWYGVPDVPEAVRTRLGTVNDRTWEMHPPGHVRKFRPHSLIYLGFHIQTRRQINGSFAHDLSLLFSFFNEGHNKELAFPRGGEYRWTTMTTKSYDSSNDGYINASLYPETNFNDLFQLPDRQT